MINLREQLKGMLVRPGKWQKILEAASRMAPSSAQPSHLIETRNFGSNPGELGCSATCRETSLTTARSWSCCDARKALRATILVRDGRR